MFRRGIWAAALTPMQPNFDCDTSELFKHCQDLLARGCAGIVLFGTTGEGPSFSAEERIDLLEKLIEAGLDPTRIIMAGGSSALQETVQLMRAAHQFRCAGVLLAPPCYFKGVSDEGILAFYREVMKRADCPKQKVLLYHIPKLSGVPLTLNLVRALVKEFPDQIVGLKESEGNLAFTKSLLQALPSFQVYVGQERQIAEAVQAGAAGSICGLANLYPELLTSQGADPAEKLKSFFIALGNLHFIPAFKQLLEAKRGAAWRTVRPPLFPLSEQERETFLNAVEAIFSSNS